MIEKLIFSLWVISAFITGGCLYIIEKKKKENQKKQSNKNIKSYVVFSFILFDVLTFLVFLHYFIK